MQRNDDEKKANMANPAAKYTDEFRRETADYAISTGRPISECCRELGLDSKTVNQWVIKRRRELSGQPDPKAEDRELREARKRIRELEMLAGLEGRLDGEGAPLLHSDMGWQYQMPAYRLALERMGIVQSMSRKGNRLDNAKAENFFSMVKTELYYNWEGDDPDVFERDLGKYIDWYNNVRIKKRLDGSSPVEYRLGRAA